MNSSSLYTYRCWDTNRVPVVINKEAVSVDAPVFLATHSPFHKITYLKTPAQLSSTSEDELLSELQRRTASDQHSFAVIQGIPGSGKSHLIRWLKERYASDSAQSGSQDIVLLIERANNTLRQTLQQILDSNVFDPGFFAPQREKLARSASQLSEQGLEETLINNLQIAYVEDKAKGQPSLRRNLERHLNDFLLDSTVRSELRSVSGPIKRIARFLAAGNTRDTEDLSPTFQPDDFDFKVDFLRLLRQHGARPDTSDLVAKLGNEQNRKELADYLNHLLEFAIGRTTALSSDDLKQMFNDLRRELRRQNRSLALFIEDITAFTGLDTGLLDILITQHTGEGNKAFCRLLSVVGVTDDYYNQRFPENVRDRVSHRLTLNAQTLGQSNITTELLSSQEETAGLAARYLNAIRLHPDVLQKWFDESAQEDQLPIVCDLCVKRDSCHAAFGTVKFSNSNGEVKTVGLYPFNANALWTMYQNIDTSKALRTPRTLLNGIISHILLSHSHLIADGRFPPSRTRVGSEFDAPNLRFPEQRSLFSANNLSAQERDRIESLVVFWGDRTLNATQSDGDKYLGSLSALVFQAFGVPFIEGQTASVTSTPGSVVIDAGKQSRSEGSDKLGGEAIQQPDVSRNVKDDPIVRDIENWRTGNPLQNYGGLGQALARFLRDTIDWESYGISRSLVDERIRQTRFQIEGQAGRSIPRYTLPLKRTETLINAFYALHRLEAGTDSLNPDQLSTHLTALTVWLAENEKKIIDFVQVPQENAQHAPSLLAVQQQTIAALAALAGELNSESAQPADLLARRLIRYCAGPNKWKSASDEAQIMRANSWYRLTQNKTIANNIEVIRSGFLENLNCPQGLSKSVLFIDMASLLDSIREFRTGRWTLSPVSFGGEGETWQKLLATHGILVESFAGVLEEERKMLHSQLETVNNLIGAVSGRELDKAIRQFLSALSNAGYPPPSSLTEANKPAFSTMEATLTVINNLIAETNLANFAPGISGATANIERLQGYVLYLEALREHAVKRGSAWKDTLANEADAKSQLDQMYATVNELYTSTVASLAALIPQDSPL